MWVSHISESDMAETDELNDVSQALHGSGADGDADKADPSQAEPEPPSREQRERVCRVRNALVVLSTAYLSVSPASVAAVCHSPNPNPNPNHNPNHTPIPNPNPNPNTPLTRCTTPHSPPASLPRTCSSRKRRHRLARYLPTADRDHPISATSPLHPPYTSLHLPYISPQLIETTLRMAEEQAAAAAAAAAEEEAADTEAASTTVDAAAPPTKLNAEVRVRVRTG